MVEHSIAVAAAAAASEQSASRHGHHSRYGSVPTAAGCRKGRTCGKTGHIAAGCRKGSGKNLYAVDEDENENIEESVEEEDDLQAWCLAGGNQQTKQTKSKESQTSITTECGEL